MRARLLEDRGLSTAWSLQAFAIGFLQGVRPMTMACGAVPRISLMALIIIAIIATTPLAQVIAQTCNPAIDGTYCAEQMGRRPDGTPSRSNPSIGRDAFSIVRDNDPATFGAITFGGGTRCIGILRRSSCN
jgi:hypothetical protein